MKSTSKQQIGVLSLSLISINIILNLRNITFASTIGPSAVFFWIFAAFLYFVPISLMVAELATTYPNQGGMGVWIKKAFGDKASFLCSWFFWIANFTYYPSLLITSTVALSYGINQPQLAENPMSTALFSCIFFWIITLLTIRGTKMSKKLSALGAPLGVLVPAALILGFGIYSVLKGYGSATTFNTHNILPTHISFNAIMFLSTLMFSFSGSEMLGTIAGNIKKPQTTFPRAIFMTSFIIALIYILATLSFQFVVKISPDQTATALYLFANQITHRFSLPFSLSQLLGLCFVLAFVGSLSFIILNPTVMIAESAKNVFSEKMLKKNESGMPVTLIIGQAVVVSIILLLSAFIPTVSKALNMLILMSTLAFFIPYVFFISAYIKLRFADKVSNRPFKIKKDWIAYTVAAMGMLSVLGTILLSIIPSKNVHLIEYIPIVAGPIIFGLIGIQIYNVSSKKKISVRTDK